MADELVYLRGEGGVVRKHKLPLPEGIADRLAKGYIKRVNEDGSAWKADGGADHDPGRGVSAPKRPAVNDTKAAWVAWAVSENPSLSPDDADAMTKADLVERYSK